MPSAAIMSAGHSGAQEFFLLLARAELLEHRQGDFRLHHQRHVDAAAIGIGHGFQVGRGGPPIQAQAAPFRIDTDAEQSQVRGLLEKLSREDAGVVPLFGVRRDLFAAEPFHGLADHFVFFGEVRKFLFGFGGNRNLAHDSVLLRADLDQHLAGRDHLPGLDQDRLDSTVDCSSDRLFHFHGFQNHQGSPVFTCCPSLTRMRRTWPGMGELAVSCWLALAGARMTRETCWMTLEPFEE